MAAYRFNPCGQEQCPCTVPDIGCGGDGAQCGYYPAHPALLASFESVEGEHCSCLEWGETPIVLENLPFGGPGGPPGCVWRFGYPYIYDNGPPPGCFNCGIVGISIYRRRGWRVYLWIRTLASDMCRLELILENLLIAFCPPAWATIPVCYEHRWGLTRSASEGYFNLGAPLVLPYEGCETIDLGCSDPGGQWTCDECNFGDVVLEPA